MLGFDARKIPLSGAAAGYPWAAPRYSAMVRSSPMSSARVIR